MIGYTDTYWTLQVSYAYEQDSATRPKTSKERTQERRRRFLLMTATKAYRKQFGIEQQAEEAAKRISKELGFKINPTETFGITGIF